MKKALFPVLLSSIAFISYGQTIDTSKIRQPIYANPGYRYQSIEALLGLVPPRDTVKLAAKDSGALAYKNGRFWQWSGVKWDSLVGKSGSGGGAAGGDTLWTGNKTQSIWYGGKYIGISGIPDNNSTVTIMGDGTTAANVLKIQDSAFNGSPRILLDMISSQNGTDGSIGFGKDGSPWWTIRGQIGGGDTSFFFGHSGTGPGLIIYQNGKGGFTKISPITDKWTTGAGDGTLASLRLSPGISPTGGNLRNGQVWYDSTDNHFYGTASGAKVRLDSLGGGGGGGSLPQFQVGFGSGSSIVSTSKITADSTNGILSMRQLELKNNLGTFNKVLFQNNSSTVSTAAIDYAETANYDDGTYNSVLSIGINHDQSKAGFGYIRSGMESNWQVFPGGGRQFESHPVEIQNTGGQIWRPASWTGIKTWASGQSSWLFKAGQYVFNNDHPSVDSPLINFAGGSFTSTQYGSGSQFKIIHAGNNKSIVIKSDSVNNYAYFSTDYTNGWNWNGPVNFANDISVTNSFGANVALKNTVLKNSSNVSLKFAPVNSTSDNIGWLANTGYMALGINGSNLLGHTASTEGAEFLMDARGVTAPIRIGTTATSGTETFTSIGADGRWGFGQNVQSPAVAAYFNFTDAIRLPSGTTAQRPSGANAYIRYNSDSSRFEGYNGGWKGIAWTSDAGGTTIYTGDGSIAANRTVTLGSNNLTFSAVSTGRFKINGRPQVTPSFITGFAADSSVISVTSVPVALGGTGMTSATAYALLAGGTTSTGAHQSLGTGTAGQILQSNGSSALPTWVDAEKVYVDSLSTSDASGSTVRTFTTIANQSYEIKITVTAILSNGAANYSCIKSRSFLIDNTGTGSQEATANPIHGDTYLGTGLTTATGTVELSGNNIIIKVTGEAAKTIYWKITTELVSKTQGA